MGLKPRTAQSIDIHLRVVAWLYMILGVVGAISTIVFGYMIYIDSPFALPAASQDLLVRSGIGTGLLVILGLASIASIVTAAGLFRLRHWAQRLLVLLAILGIFDFPIGTVISAYTLWVLYRSQSMESVK